VRVGCRRRGAYVQTDSFKTSTKVPYKVIRPGSMGLPYPECPIEVNSPESHSPLPAGETGLLAIKLPTNNLMIGYWNNPEKTAACFVTNAAVE